MHYRTNSNQTTNRTRTDAYTQDPHRHRRPRTDASGGWRAEYALQVVDDAHEPRADGGRYVLPTVGSRVRDRDGDDGDELLVVNVDGTTTAADHTIEALDATVADVNPAYDPAAPVVEAVYVEELEAALDGWRGVEDVKDAISFDAIASYTFPVDRLASTPGGDSA